MTRKSHSIRSTAEARSMGIATRPRHTTRALTDKALLASAIRALQSPRKAHLAGKCVICTHAYAPGVFIQQTPAGPAHQRCITKIAALSRK